jgi:hypothetical protein
MPAERPFIVSGSATLDTDRIIRESIPVAKLIAAFGAVALVPFAIGVLLGGPHGIGLLFVLLAQFTLAVGSAVVLMFVVARGVTLAGSGGA